MPDPRFALEMLSITKHFGNLRAVSAVSFALRRGTLHALLGENGAGKTTLMRIAFGMLPPDAGEIRVEGRARRIRSPHDAISLGIGMVHQHFMLIPAMTVAENVELGGRGRYNAEESARKLKLLEQKTGLLLDPSAKVSSLSIPAQQRLEIVKALAHDARILILDEPTAVLAPHEAQDLLSRVRDLVRAGLSVVLITHKLNDARQYADEVSVLRHGELVLSGRMADFEQHRLANAMLGDDADSITAQSIAARPPEGEAVITLRDVGFVDDAGVRRLRNVSLDVHTGEVVGIAALEGNASSLMRVLAGRLAPTEGRCTLPQRMGFIPEDRQHDALVPAFTLYENVALKDSGKRKGRMPWTEIRERTVALIKDFEVRTEGLNMPARTLSGGNQQRLVLGRELSDTPVAIVAENPTRGLDINAAGMIHERLGKARHDGCAVVFYSSDIDEIVDLADRVFVLRDGTLTPTAVDSEAIGSALLAQRGTAR